MNQLRYAADVLSRGVDIDGYLAAPAGAYRILRYIGIEAEDQEVIKHPDWYGIAWVSLLQMLPNDRLQEVLLTPDFPIQADHVKFYIVKEECEQYLHNVGHKNAEISVLNGDIILILNQPTEK
jgi:hypothetical protein